MSEAYDVEYTAGVVRFGGKKPPGPPLQPPGGGGTYDPMLEARVASLEADVRNIRETVGEMKADLRSAGTDLSEIKVNYATLSERVSHLPSKGYIGWWITGGVSLAIAVLTLFSKLGWLVAGAPK
jgi:hypothetical protein